MVSQFLCPCNNVRGLMAADLLEGMLTSGDEVKRGAYRG